jgi:large subunit ribosomal protein L4
MKLEIMTLDGKKAGSVELDAAIFGIKEIRGDILQRMVNYQLAKRRAGTHKTLSRGEVARSRSKIYRQKGTGNARHGSANAPIFRGGAHAHNRLPRDYSFDLPKKVRAMALKHALSAKAGAGELIVLDSATLKAPKTADLKAKLAKLGLDNVLVIAGAEVDENLALAARNIPNLDVLPNAGLNVYDVLRRHKLVLTQDAIAAINERFSGVKVAKAAPKTEAAPKKRAPAKKAAALFNGAGSGSGLRPDRQRSRTPHRKPAHRHAQLPHSGSHARDYSFIALAPATGCRSRASMAT